jgi:hypothetical protein
MSQSKHGGERHKVVQEWAPVEGGEGSSLVHIPITNAVDVGSCAAVIMIA